MTEHKGISDLDIERFVLRELSESRLAEIDRLRAADPTLEARIAAVSLSDAEILESYPPRQTAAAIREAAEKGVSRSKSRWRVALPVIGTAAASVVLALAFLPGNTTAPETRSPAQSGDDPNAHIRLKGPTEPSLFVFRKGETGDERLLPGQIATAGDVVQLKYAAKGAPYGVIFSVDGRGTVTLHYPSNDAVPAKLETKGTHALDFSYELDDAPSYERFFFVTANHPIDARQVIEKARLEKPGAEERLSLDPTLSQCDFVLKKTQ